ncbi:MAG: LCP family protein [Oscillospiraceae bacterium]|jgi:LCP family protein required for cell wall assembly|nr:LCP family protein [Oscillospiraceae bacterium]
MNEEPNDWSAIASIDKSKRTTPQKRKRLLIAAAVAVVAVVGITLAAAISYRDLLGGITVDPGTVPSGYAPETANVTEPPDPNFESMYDITDAANLNSFLYQWWNNDGDILYSRDVLNVLLLGIDNDDNSVGTGRSDTMLMVSINKKTNAVTLLSFLRDSYCYYDVNGTTRYDRINTSFHHGGAAGLMETISKLYKIRVDKYVSVDFESFPKLIDALGGVTVDVTQSEAKYINRTAPSMNKSFPFGEDVLLNGKQALVFSRIRKLDSEINRTRRQRSVIQAILQSARTASIAEVYRALDQTLPYVKTNYTRTEILGLVPSAHSWLNYSMDDLSSPLLSGSERTAIGATIRGMSIWIVDYPAEAQRVQNLLYGKTNINLTDDAERNAYIRDLFLGAAEKGSTDYERFDNPQTETQTDSTTESEDGGTDIALNETESDESMEEAQTQTKSNTDMGGQFWGGLF